MCPGPAIRAFGPGALSTMDSMTHGRKPRVRVFRERHRREAHPSGDLHVKRHIIARFGPLFLTSLYLLLLGNAAPADATSLDDVRNRGSVRIGYLPGEVPFSDAGSTGKPVGYSIDLCSRVVDHIGARLGKELRREWVEVNTNTRFQLLDKNAVDVVCAATTITRDRLKRYDFSYSMFVAGTRTMTKRGADIDTWQDLSGRTVGVVADTTGEALMRDLDGRLSLGTRFVTARDSTSLFALLEKGEVAAVGYDDVLLSEFAARSAAGQAAFVFFDRYLSVEPYGLMMQKDSGEFTRAVNAALEDLYTSGEIRTIYARWFLNDQRTVPMSRYLSEDIRLPNTYPAFP